PMWLRVVEDAVEEFKSASAEDQELVCVGLGQEYAPEAAAKAREMFAAIRPKVRLEERGGLWYYAGTSKRYLGPKPQPAKPAIEDILTSALSKSAPGARQVPDGKGPVIEWPEGWPEAQKAPAMASAFERLLYPPGLLGHAVQYIVDTSPLPDRQLALAVALSSLAKGIDRKVVGPSGNSCVLFNQVLAETGAGKHQGISCSRSLLRAMGLEASIVASGLASVQAIEEIIEGVESANPLSGIEPNPNALVVIDEVGSWLMRILAKSQGG